MKLKFGETMQTQNFKQPQACAKLLKSLGNVYRLQIIQLLMGGEKNVTELNTQVKVSQPALSQHLARLRKEGIVAARRNQRQIFYRISNPQILRILAVVDDVVSQRDISANAAQPAAEMPVIASDEMSKAA
jgi:ArsR family transcriptional regulator